MLLSGSTVSHARLWHLRFFVVGGSGLFSSLMSLFTRVVSDWKFMTIPCLRDSAVHVNSAFDGRAWRVPGTSLWWRQCPEKVQRDCCDPAETVENMCHSVFFWLFFLGCSKKLFQSLSVVHWIGKVTVSTMLGMWAFKSLLPLITDSIDGLNARSLGSMEHFLLFQMMAAKLLEKVLPLLVPRW